MPVINGLSFDIIAFFTDLTKQEINVWLKGKIRYGVYIEESIPIFLLELGKAWQWMSFENSILTKPYVFN